FLPETIEEDKAILRGEKDIPDVCYDMIDKSPILILVTPYGNDTAAEIGYTIHYKRTGRQKMIIKYVSEQENPKKVHMIDKYISYSASTLDELVYAVHQAVRSLGIVVQHHTRQTT